jgi:hypothetical protein
VSVASSIAAARYARRARPDEHRAWPTPGALARAINAKTVQTPALDVIDQVLVDAYRTPDSRTIISMPPQEGKSERVTKSGTLWALIENPDLRVAIASYAQPLAEGFGRDIRNWITTNDGTEGTLDLGLRVPATTGPRALAARRATAAASSPSASGPASPAGPSTRSSSTTRSRTRSRPTPSHTGRRCGSGGSRSLRLGSRPARRSS